jgi:hypothetical protein
MKIANFTESERVATSGGGALTVPLNFNLFTIILPLLCSHDNSFILK